VVGGYVRKRVTLRISKGLRAVALAIGISWRVYSDTRVIFITIIAIYIALPERIGTPLIIPPHHGRQQQRWSRWRWLWGQFPVPAGCRNKDFCPPKLVFDGGDAAELFMDED
jgi:hypothetical protein